MDLYYDFKFELAKSLKKCIDDLFNSGQYFTKASLQKMENIDKTCKELGCKQEKCETFKLPKENSIRNLISFRKKMTTNKKFPRKFEQIKKNPL